MWMRRRKKKKDIGRVKKTQRSTAAVPGMNLRHRVKSEQILKISKSLCTQEQPERANVSPLTSKKYR